jgi:hypothetical protein
MNSSLDTHGIGINSILIPHRELNYHVCHPEETAQPCVSSELPGGAPLGGDVVEVIQKYMISGTRADWWRPLFNLRRALDPLAKARGWREVDWRSVVAWWLVASNKSGAGLPGFDSVWCEFKKKLALPIEVPPGSVLASAKDVISSVAIPSALVGTNLEAAARTMASLSQERSSQGSKIFYVSLRMVADLSGITGSNKARHASNPLYSLRNLGYLSLHQAGTEGIKKDGKASEYQWHDPPIRGTPWNSNRKMGKAKPPTPTDQTPVVSDPDDSW